MSAALAVAVLLVGSVICACWAVSSMYLWEKTRDQYWREQAHGWRDRAMVLSGIALGVAVTA